MVSPSVLESSSPSPGGLLSPEGSEEQPLQAVSSSQKALAGQGPRPAGHPLAAALHVGLSLFLGVLSPLFSSEEDHCL